MTKWYYYDANGIKQGLIDDAKLKILVAHGIVKPETLIETEDGKTATAEKIKGLEFCDQKRILLLRLSHQARTELLALKIDMRGQQDEWRGLSLYCLQY